MSSAPVLPGEAMEIAAGYAFTGPALDLGALLWDGSCLPDAQVRIPLPMLNRHGLVAGANCVGVFSVTRTPKDVPGDGPRAARQPRPARAARLHTE